MERDEVWYLDIDGVLNRYALSGEQLEECLNYLNTSLDYLKLDDIDKEELNEAISSATVTINFVLPYEFSKYTIIEKILPMNNIYLDSNKDTFLNIRKVNNSYYYTIKIPNYSSHLYKQFDLKHNFKKQFKYFYRMDAWRTESVEALNELYDMYKPKKVVIISGWRKEWDKLVDWMKMYGVKIPAQDLEYFVQTNSDRGISIAEDLKKRGLPKNYKVIDDSIFPSYICFKGHLISCNNKVGLTKEDIKVNEKEMVKKYGN